MATKSQRDCRSLSKEEKIIMIKVLELLEIDEGLYIVPDEISEITIINTKQFGDEHIDHTLITMKNGNHYVAPLKPMDLFQNWVKSAKESPFHGVDIYTIYKDDEDENKNLTIETKNE